MIYDSFFGAGSARKSASKTVGEMSCWNCVNAQVAQVKYIFEWNYDCDSYHQCHV